MEKKIVLVTGGSGGIGSEICKELSKENFYVYINCRSEEKAQDLLNKILEFGGEGEILAFDINSKQEIDKSISKIKSEKIDVLINNAGVLIDDLIYNIKMENWDLIFNTNFIAGLQVYKAIFNKLSISKNPIVISMCSIAGIRPRKGQLSYGVSKAMIINWTENIAKYNKNIKYYAISPGPVETELIKTSKWYKETKSMKRIPLERYASPNEIAEFIVHIVTNTNVFKSGSNIVLDGGFLQTTKE